MFEKAHSHLKEALLPDGWRVVKLDEKQLINAQVVAAVVTTPDRNQVMLKERDEGQAIASGSGALQDKMGVEYAAFREVRWDTGVRELVPNLKLIGVYQVIEPSNIPKIVALFEAVIDAGTKFAPSKPESTKKGQWVDTDKLSLEKKFAYEHKFYLNEWMEKRQNLLNMVS